MGWRECTAIVANNLGLAEERVQSVYEGYWRFIKDSIELLPLKEVKSEEDFKKLRTNFNVPYLGKLTCSYKRFLGVKKRVRILEEKKNESKEN